MQVHSPIVALDGDMALALYGSALPLPDLASFGVPHGWTKHAHTRRAPPPLPLSPPGPPLTPPPTHAPRPGPLPPTR